jgi:hypothetical protein
MFLVDTNTDNSDFQTSEYISSHTPSPQPEHPRRREASPPAAKPVDPSSRPHALRDHFPGARGHRLAPPTPLARWPIVLAPLADTWRLRALDLSASSRLLRGIPPRCVLAAKGGLNVAESFRSNACSSSSPCGAPRTRPCVSSLCLSAWRGYPTLCPSARRDSSAPTSLVPVPRLWTRGKAYRLPRAAMSSWSCACARHRGVVRAHVTSPRHVNSAGDSTAGGAGVE